MVKNKKVRFFEGFVFNNWLEAIGTLVLMVVVLAVCTVGPIMLLLHNDNAVYDYEDTVTYWVEQGDTLWTIARQYSGNKQDVRRVIDIIEEINDCTATIYPGDCLDIPVFTNLTGRD